MKLGLGLSLSLWTLAAGGSEASTVATPTMSATGSEVFTGTEASTVATPTMAATATEVFTGTAASTVGAPTCAASGHEFVLSDVSGLVIDLNGDLGVTGTTHVTAWVDQQSSKSFAGSAVTGPAAVANGLGTHTTIEFPGAPTGTGMGPTAFTLPATCTVIAVMKCAPGASGVADIMFDGNTISTLLAYNDTRPQSGLIESSNLAFAGNLANGAWAVDTWNANGASSTIRENGTSKVNGSVGSATPSGFTIGSLPAGTRSAPVKFARILIFNVALSTSDMQSVEQLLRGTYGLA